MANDCRKHAGKRNEFQREQLDHQMRKLPENQSGAGRHKCPYCAYEQGFVDGLRQAGKALGSLLVREAGVSMREPR